MAFTAMIPKIDQKETGARIKSLMKEKGIRLGDVMDYFNFQSGTTVYKWYRGETLPNIDNLYALSYLFQMPMDDIICGDRPPFGKE